MMSGIDPIDIDDTGSSNDFPNKNLNPKFRWVDRNGNVPACQWQHGGIGRAHIRDRSGAVALHRGSRGGDLGSVL